MKAKEDTGYQTFVHEITTQIQEQEKFIGDMHMLACVCDSLDQAQDTVLWLEATELTSTALTSRKNTQTKRQQLNNCLQCTDETYEAKLAEVQKMIEGSKAHFVGCQSSVKRYANILSTPEPKP